MALKLWNTLPTEVVNAQSINEFKNLLANLLSVILMYTVLYNLIVEYLNTLFVVSTL